MSFTIMQPARPRFCAAGPDRPCSSFLDESTSDNCGRIFVHPDENSSTGRIFVGMDDNSTAVKNNQRNAIKES